MSDARWTPEQLAAIEAWGTNVLVAAAAGSGKTATLVERVIRRLLREVDPLNVDELLVVTFTEAAATEMRDRIGAALQRAMEADPDNSRLRLQQQLLQRASISTLHAFCLGLLRQYFYRLGLDPAVQVMGEHEALLLRAEVLDTLFADEFDKEPEGPFYALVDRYGGGRDDEGLRTLVMDLYDYTQSLPSPEGWLAEAVGRFEVADGAGIDALPWWPPLRRQMHLQLVQAEAALRQAFKIAITPGGPDYAAVLAGEIERAEAAVGVLSSETCTWAEASAAVYGIVFEPRLPPQKAGTCDEELKEKAGKQRSKAKELVGKLRETYFARAESEWVSDLRTVAPHLRTLADLVGEFGKRFRQAKADQGAVDFNDLERFALQLLSDPAAPPGERPSDVARELRHRYREILVDEYQDINGVQDAILRLVARDGTDAPANRFMVGDVKQSIYRFRHANPGIFLQKYREYGAWAGAPAGEEAGARIVLGANFRSRGGVVDGVNFLFRQIMSPEVGELAYDRDAELVCRAGYGTRFDPATGEVEADPAVEVHLLDRSLASDEGEAEVEDGESAPESPELLELAEQTALEREARLVARRIRQLVDGAPGLPPMQVWDKEAGGYRRARYRDVVLLLRATTGKANVLVETLGQAGIPAYAQLATGYFAATEVEVILSLLHLLDNPRQDIPLAAVLRSPIMQLSAADLALIRVAAPEGSFYDAVLAAARDEADQTGLRPVLITFLERLNLWRTAARRRPLSQVVWQVYQETGYLNFVGGMPGGAQRKANLLALYDRARQFDQFARQGLFRFLRFIERLREEEADMGTAPALGEGEDVVRIMSIHKSKGLEFPVVFVLDMGKAWANMDQRGDLLLQRALGFGPHLVDPDLRVKYPTLAWYGVREQIRLEALAEEMRVLYVALTRARERLILIGSCKDVPGRCERWAAALGLTGWSLSDATVAAADSYLDWIGPALMRHGAGTPLRAKANLVQAPSDQQVAGDASRWEIRLWEMEALAAELSEIGPQQAAQPLDWERVGALEPLDRPFEPEAVAELQRRFDWRYPYADLVPRFAKLSVTELKGQIRPDSDGPEAGQQAPWLRDEDAPPVRRVAGHLQRYPAFMQEARKTMTPTELGTLMHLVLQHLDLAGLLDEAGVRAQVDRMVVQQIVRPEQAEAVDTGAIAQFFASPLGTRVREQPERVRREVSFTLAMEAGDVYADLPPAVTAGESVIVQGMIDLLLETDDGFVLVDYKTDKRDPQDAAERYRGQVATYRRAVEAILGRPVTEAYLHFLNAGVSVLIA